MLKQISSLTARRAAPLAARPVSTQFESLGSKFWTDETFKGAVSDATYTEFKSSIVTGEPLSSGAKKEVASALKDWALSHGCVYYAHMFFPLRIADGRAQAAFKFDSMVDLDFGSSEVLKPVVGDAISTGMLFQSETDGSSFPNGGLRMTHRAAAFMSWDKKSPPYIIGDTMFLPAAFVTHHGEALDHKTPLLRSEEAINKEGLRLLRNLGDTTAERVVSNVGWEQEYFLVDRDTFVQRPDLVMTGRTLFGAQSPRNQEGSEQYFGVPYPRAKMFMEDISAACWEANMALKVNHNEVAPGQHELSPVFALTNVASDQNMICMDLMDSIAARHGLKCLVHEKPFAGINGSGKHSNWGLNTDTGKNLYHPGKTEEKQGDFFAFTAALTSAIAKHGDILRVAVAHAGNDHRLGAQEAPPAIVSLYTGELMEEHIKKIVDGGSLFGYNTEGKSLDFGSGSVESVERGLEDRNRTAPFPFCGNRFEFRAVGSSQCVAQPMSYLNTIVAEGCAELSDKIEGGMSPRDAVAATYKENLHVLFNGNGYSAEWPVEAAKRGLPNLVDTPQALATFNSAKNKEVFSKMGVFTPEEVDARQNVMLGEYSNVLLIEAETALNMANQLYLPALAEDLAKYSGAAASLAGDRAATYAAVGDATAALKAAVEGAPGDDSLQELADYFAYEVKPKLGELRAAVDAAEVLCSDWPVPSYIDLLFHHQSEDVKLMN